MSKSTKTKAATEKTVEVKSEVKDNVTHVSVEETEKEPNMGDAPPSVTLDEVEHAKEEPIREYYVGAKPTEELLKALDDYLSNEQKILNYLEDKPKGEIRMNDFLKSLFGVAKLNEPPMWQSQSASKEIKNLLDKINGGEYEVMGNAHLRLGTTHYPDTNTMRAAQHDLNSVSIFIKKVN